jgi:protein dithiol oxidoreductase (disulfide-forming)
MSPELPCDSRFLARLPCFGSSRPQQWKEGKNYFSVTPAQPINVPAGKIEVTEVFSYACPACNRFNPFMDRLRKTLPTTAAIDYVAAAFGTSEDWPVFQRAYYTAKTLGIAATVHDAMFDAVWKNGELQIFDPQTRRLKNPLPGIEDVAKWYHEQTGIPTQTFLSAARSPKVAAQMRQADSYIMACHVTGTPTIIVDGRYRVDPVSAGDYGKMIALVKWLVARQTQSRPAGMQAP